MSYERYEISGYEFLFQAGKGGTLSLSPVALLDYEVYPPQGNYLYTLVTFKEGPFHVRFEDYFTAGDFVGLYNSLLGCQQGTHKNAVFQAVESGREVSFQYRPGHGDVAVVGTFPSPVYYDVMMASDPLCFRDLIKIDFRFEFWIVPEKLIATMERLKEFLDKLGVL